MQFLHKFIHRKSQAKCVEGCFFPLGKKIAAVAGYNRSAQIAKVLETDTRDLNSTKSINMKSKKLT